LFEDDSRFGWFHIPGRKGWYRSKEYTTLISINSHGLRDVERTYDNALGACRILILGDSFAEGMQVPFEDTVGSQLEKLLNARGGSTVEVINGGVSGFGTDRELLFYQAEGRLYHPGLVLLFFFRNDPADNGASPFFFLDGEVLRKMSAAPPESPPPGRDARRWVWDHLATVRLVGHSWTRLGEMLGRFAQPVTALDPVYQVPTPPEIEADWNLTAALLSALRAAVEADGATLAVVHVPEAVSLADVTARPGYAPDAISARLGRIAADLDIPYVDLRDSFVDEGEGAASRYYWPEDGHWKPAGHRLAAEVIDRNLSATTLATPGLCGWTWASR
jgi:hypothetical protein